MMVATEDAKTTPQDTDALDLLDTMVIKKTQPFDKSTLHHLLTNNRWRAATPSPPAAPKPISAS